MKKIISLMLIASLVISIFVATPTNAIAVGSNSTNAISSVEDFMSMEADGTYYLNANITVLTTYTSEFKGVFDGNGYVVTTTVPMFENVSGTVENLITEGSVVLSSLTANAGAVAKLANNATFADIVNHANVTGEATAGGVVGKATGNCTFTNITNTGIINGSHAGGIVGTVENTTEKLNISDCTNEGSIKATTHGGGIVSFIDSSKGYTIDNCINKGNVQSSLKAVGGIVGLSTQPNGLIKNCINGGNITGSTQTGGILGYSYYSLVFENCLNDTTAYISGNGTGNYSGGIVSRIGEVTTANDITVFKNCINKGTVVSTINHCGGIIAYSTISAYFDSCYNNGNITGKKYAGGISGCIDYYADFINCINYGKVISENDKAGGISGNVGSGKAYSHIYKYESCGNEGEVQGENYSSGIAAYLYGGNSKSASFMYCYNVGKIISDESYVTGVLGYIDNVGNLTIKYNYIGGTISSSSNSYATVYINSDRSSNGIYHDYNYVKSGLTNFLYHNADKCDVSIIEEGEEKYKYVYTANDLSSGKLAHTINTSVGKDVFFQTLGDDVYPTTNKSHHAVRFDVGYRNIFKATFVKGNNFEYIDVDTGENFTVPEWEGTLYWQCEGIKIIPNSAYQLTEDKTFQAVKIAINTYAGASVRISEGTSGLRFYTYLDKSDYDTIVTELSGTQFRVTQGTVIAPYTFVYQAGEFTMEALDKLDKSSDRYLNIISAGLYRELEGEYIVAGSIINLGEDKDKRDNRALDFGGIGYVCITDILNNNSYYLYSETYSVRNVSAVATKALDDTSDTSDQGYCYVILSGTNQGKYSPYTESQRILLESFVVSG